MKIEGSTSYPSCGKFDWHGEQQRNVALGLGFRQGFGGETTRRELVVCLLITSLFVSALAVRAKMAGSTMHVMDATSGTVPVPHVKPAVAATAP